MIACSRITCCWHVQAFVFFSFSSCVNLVLGLENVQNNTFFFFHSGFCFFGEFAGERANYVNTPHVIAMCGLPARYVTFEL